MNNSFTKYFSSGTLGHTVKLLQAFFFFLQFLIGLGALIKWTYKTDSGKSVNFNGYCVFTPTGHVRQMIFYLGIELQTEQKLSQKAGGFQLSIICHIRQLSPSHIPSDLS